MILNQAMLSFVLRGGKDECAWDLFFNKVYFFFFLFKIASSDINRCYIGIIYNEFYAVYARLNISVLSLSYKTFDIQH